MSNPFQDQFLKLGLVDKKKVAKDKKQKHQEKKAQSQGKKAAPKIDENALIAQQEQEKRRARDQELNRQREEKLRQRETAGAIRQMIEQGRIAKDPNGIAYRFTDGKKIQRIFVAADIADQLAKGKLGVVRQTTEYEVLAPSVLEKIRKLDATIFIYQAEVAAESDEDDPYAEYKIPDDLMW